MAITFDPTANGGVASLAKGDRWRNSYFNSLVANLMATFGALNFNNDFENQCIIMDQNLHGGYNSTYGFQRMFLNDAVADPCASKQAVVSPPSAAIAGLKSSTTYVEATADANAVAIQRAIDSLPSTGGTVLIPPGFYYIRTNTLTGYTIYLCGTGTPKPNVKLVGFGDASHLYLYNGSLQSSAFSASNNGSSVSGLEVSNLKIESNGTASTGITATDSASMLVEDVTFKGFYHNAVRHSDSYDLKVIDCKFIECGRTGSANLGGVGCVISPVPPTYDERLTVSGCLFVECHNGVTTYSTSDVIIEGNYFIDSVAASVYSAIDASADAEVKGLRVSGNMFYKYEQATGYDINISSAGTNVSKYISGISITENMSSCRWAGFCKLFTNNSSAGVRTRLDPVVIYANSVFNSGANGYHIIRLGTKDTSAEAGIVLATVSGNIIMDSYRANAIQIDPPDTSPNHYTSGLKAEYIIILGNCLSDSRWTKLADSVYFQDKGVYYYSESASYTDRIKYSSVIGNVVFGNKNGQVVVANAAITYLDASHNIGFDRIQ